MKININFPIGGDTLADCLQVNNIVRQKIGSVIRFGSTGNSSPHVTLLMGDVVDADFPSVAESVRELANSLPPSIPAEFGPPYRETVTGRYIFSDVSVPYIVSSWRSGLRSTISKYFASSARMTEEDLHLTLAVLEVSSAEIDASLRSLPSLRPSIFSRIDISLAGDKGAKLDILQELNLHDD